MRFALTAAELLQLSLTCLIRAILGFVGMQETILAAAVMDPMSWPAGLMRGKGCTLLQQVSPRVGSGQGAASSSLTCRVATPSRPGPPLADGPKNNKHRGACGHDSNRMQLSK